MNVEFLIIGQGLAGSTLALELLKRERSVLVVDRQDHGSSTRVAAGLVTPLTGKGMNPAWRQHEYLPKAVDFYHRLEKQSGRKLYHKTPVVRLFLSDKELAKWRGKARSLDEWAFDMASVDIPFKGIFGGIEMPEGAWLDTVAFLQVVKDHLLDANSWREDEFLQSDVSNNAETLCWKDVRAEKIILCQGAYGLGKGGWFGNVPHRSAKGEVLCLWAHGLDEAKRYHANGWMAPRGGGMWKAGANYDWDRLDSVPTEAGKQEVLDKLATWLPDDMPLEIISHEAGVRPIIRNSRPVVLFHPTMSSVVFYNGLGSKGTLMAPAVSEHLAAFLCGECDLDEGLTLKL